MEPRLAGMADPDRGELVARPGDAHATGALRLPRDGALGPRTARLFRRGAGARYGGCRGLLRSRFVRAVGDDRGQPGVDRVRGAAPGPGIAPDDVGRVRPRRMADGQGPRMGVTRGSHHIELAALLGRVRTGGVRLA